MLRRVEQFSEGVERFPCTKPYRSFLTRPVYGGIFLRYQCTLLSFLHLDWKNVFWPGSKAADVDLHINYLLIIFRCWLAYLLLLYCLPLTCLASLASRVPVVFLCPLLPSACYAGYCLASGYKQYFKKKERAMHEPAGDPLMFCRVKPFLVLSVSI